MIKLKKAWRNYNKKPERRNTKQKRKDKARGPTQEVKYT